MYGIYTIFVYYIILYDLPIHVFDYTFHASSHKPSLHYNVSAEEKTATKTAGLSAMYYKIFLVLGKFEDDFHPKGSVPLLSYSPGRPLQSSRHSSAKKLGKREVTSCVHSCPPRETNLQQLWGAPIFLTAKGPSPCSRCVLREASQTTSHKTITTLTWELAMGYIPSFTVGVQFFFVEVQATDHLISLSDDSFKCKFLLPPCYHSASCEFATPHTSRKRCVSTAKGPMASMRNLTLQPDKRMGCHPHQAGPKILYKLSRRRETHRNTDKYKHTDKQTRKNTSHHITSQRCLSHRIHVCTHKCPLRPYKSAFKHVHEPIHL